MRPSTLEAIQCVRCKGDLLPDAVADQGPEVRSALLACTGCKAKYPVIAGVAIILKDPEAYLFEHAKGVSRAAQAQEIPELYRDAYLEALSELQSAGEDEAAEEDLEAERVIQLYAANHYLSAGAGENWWKREGGSASGFVEDLIRKHWDRSPASVVEGWLKQESEHASAPLSVVELGCSVGGLLSRMPERCERYLGIDQSFASVHFARQLALGLGAEVELRAPNDLLYSAMGSAARATPFQARPPKNSKLKADFIVADLEQLPLRDQTWDASIALNLIDMLEHPEALPEAQSKHLKVGGLAVESSPYVWPERVARKLRTRIPKTVSSSAQAVEWMYSKRFDLEAKIDDQPWIFFKQSRQMEIYSVHLISARKKGT